MKKLYYKIELRMGEWLLEDKDFSDKEVDMEDIVGELFYYSDGYIIIEDEVITGFLSNDLITGNLSKNEIFIEILEKDESILQYSSYGDEFERVELPGKYALTRQDVEENPELENYFAIIKFIKKIEDASKQQKINETLKEVKKIYSIP